jgi:hypothetical protein
LLTLRTEYRQFVEQFYSYLPDTIRPIFVNDALFHKERYIDLLSEPLSGHIVEAGSDKPFITHVLRTLFPEALIDTVSMDMPNSPYPIKQVDIESELLPFDEGSIDTVIFTEFLGRFFFRSVSSVFIRGEIFILCPAPRLRDKNGRVLPSFSCSHAMHLH